MIWKTITEFPDYEISDGGIVRRRVANKWFDAGRIVKQWSSDTGHMNVKLWHSTERRTATRYIHRLLLTEFVGPPPFEGAMGLHSDDVPNNNDLRNLSWGTRKQNYEDRLRNRGWDRKKNAAKGSRVKGAKLKEADIPIIRQMRSDGKSVRSVAADFCVGTMTISNIDTKRTWAHVQ